MMDAAPLEPYGLIKQFSDSVGATEAALRLLITIFSGYPLALIHRKVFYGQSSTSQHLYFILTGLALGYFNYGTEICHSIFAVAFTYLTLVICRGTATCVAITFLFNMAYLLIGYRYASTNDYDINWTLPQCVLVLRLIGLAFDFYDGNQPSNDLSAKNKEVALTKRPTILEVFAHMFFPASFLVGPQFPMKRYQNFVAGEYSDTDDKTKAPNSIQPALERLGLGLLYLGIFQGVGLYVTDDMMVSDEFGNMSFFMRLVCLGIWGRISLYKYISCWLLTEGACIMFGLTHNGKDVNGTVKWNGLANVDILKLENATEFNHYIQSFNLNTNHWVLQYIYKRLKFAGNRFISQGAALFFLAIWHGFHTGYYVCFFFEFMVMLMEKDIHSVVAKNPHVSEFFAPKYMRVIRYILLRIYTTVFMGWCLLPFVLLTPDRYFKAFSSVNYIGAIFFLPWMPVYGPIFRYIVKATRAKPQEHTE